MELKIEDTRQENFGLKLIEWGNEGWEPILVYNNYLMVLKNGKCNNGRRVSNRS